MASDDDEPYKTRIQQMIFSKADAKYALMKGYSENIWFTKDQGNTYQKHAFGVMMDIKLHSRQPEWVLATKFEGSFPDRYLSLFLSVDFGASWKKLVTHVYQFEWVRPFPSVHPSVRLSSCLSACSCHSRPTYLSGYGPSRLSVCLSACLPVLVTHVHHV